MTRQYFRLDGNRLDDIIPLEVRLGIPHYTASHLASRLGQVVGAGAVISTMRTTMDLILLSRTAIKGSSHCTTA